MKIRRHESWLASRGPARILTALLLALMIPAVTSAQSLSPQERQQALERYQQLSPSERERVAEQFGGGQTRQSQQDTSQPQIISPLSEGDGGQSDGERDSERQRQSGDSQEPSSIERRLNRGLGLADLEVTQRPRRADEPLRQFGYELFAGVPSTFAPVTEIPVPPDYVIGPGDQIGVQLYGKVNEYYQLEVNREGQVHFPELGPISVAGKSFREVREDLQSRIAEQMIGVKASISAGDLRSMRVFVLGDVRRPGSFTVSSLSTMTNALFVSGGVKKTGSLRKIQLKRDGRVVTTLDLYDLLLDGDTSGDARLQPGDVIFVPPIGDTVAVAGEVKRPAIYELTEPQPVAEVLKMAGGAMPTALRDQAQIYRIGERGQRHAEDIDLTEAGDRSRKLADGGALRLFAAAERLDDIVLLKGHVAEPGGYAWKPDLRITDVIESVDDLLPSPDLGYVVIRRETPPDYRVEVLSVDLAKALDNPDSDANVRLRERDTVLVFSQRTEEEAMLAEEATRAGERDRSSGSYSRQQGDRQRRQEDSARFGPQADTEREDRTRQREDEERDTRASRESGTFPSDERRREQDRNSRSRDESGYDWFGEDRQDRELATRTRLLVPIIEELRSQARLGEPAQVVSISGEVRFPGDYPLEEDMTLPDLIRAAGGLQDSAYTEEAGLTRFMLTDTERQVISRNIDLDRLLKPGQADELILEPFDTVQIRRLPQWAERETIRLEGEVVFPGQYVFGRNETLQDVLNRAGGLTNEAFPKGAFFSRESLREKEQEELERLSRRLRAELSSVSLEQLQQEGGSAEAVQAAQSMLDRIQTQEAVGRLVISLPKVMKGNATVELRDGDRLIVPKTPSEVTIIGEVQRATSHLYDENLTLKDYIRRSGGMTARADDDRIYVVRADGAVDAGVGSVWFGDRGQEVQPGDTIVVPLDVTRMRPLTLWSTVGQIFQNFAVSAAALKAIDVF